MKVLSFLVAGTALLVSVGAAAAQDAAAGEKVFLAKCKVCHMPPEAAKNLVGPSLAGVVGRKAGTVSGYHYSDANEKSGITWDEPTLKEYLKDPKAKVPGTKMVFPGLKSDARHRQCHRLPQAVRARRQENLITATRGL